LPAIRFLRHSEGWPPPDQSVSQHEQSYKTQKRSHEPFDRHRTQVHPVSRGYGGTVGRAT